jgi:hypothetical protein
MSIRSGLVALLAGPDAKPDEMAVIAILIGLCFVQALMTLIGLEIFIVVVRGDRFEAEAFAAAAATLFGSAGGIISALAYAMGLKAKLGG